MLGAESLRPTSAVAGGPGAGCVTAREELMAAAGDRMVVVWEAVTCVAIPESKRTKSGT